MLATLASLGDPSAAAALLAENGYWLMYAGTVFFGEIIILVGFVLTAQHIFSFPIVFLLTILGTLTADFFWYTVGTIAAKRGRHVLSVSRMPRIFSIIDRLITRFLAHHSVITLTASKFIIGGRLLTILYLTQKGISFRRFVISDLIAVAVFISVLSVIGWGSGTGAIHFFNTSNIYIITGVALVAALLLIVVSEKIFVKELDETLS